jgi:hypothetical protein
MMIRGSETLGIVTVVVPRSADGFVVISASGGMHSVSVRVVNGRPPSRVQDGTDGGGACGADGPGLRTKANQPENTATTTVTIRTAFGLIDNSSLI